MPRIWDSTGGIPTCPTCGGTDVKYEGSAYWEGADQLYRCVICERLFDHFDPTHT